MKKLLILCIIVLLGSCSRLEITPPAAEVERTLTNYLEETGMSPAALIHQVKDQNRSVLLVGVRGVQSDLELLAYFIPVLTDMGELSLGLWFLDNVPSPMIDEYFSDDSSGLEADDLLFASDPSFTGYREYREFLEYLRDFIISLPEETHWLVSGSDTQKNNTFFIYIPYSELSTFSPRDDKYTIFIHNPVQPAEEKSYFPFQGQLYYMLIHKWPQYRYAAIDLAASPFGSLFFNSLDQETGTPVRERFDGVLLAGIEKGFTPLHRIEDFINENNAPEALEAFPRQIIRKKIKPASYLMNMKLRKEDRKWRNSLKKMSDFLSEYYPSFE